MDSAYVFGASLPFAIALLYLVFLLFTGVTAIASFGIGIWEFFIRHYFSSKNNKLHDGIELKEPLTIEDLLLKLRNNLDFPELIKLYYDDKVRIVAECSYSTSIIYIEDNKVYVVPKSFSSRISFSKSIENANCLRKCVEKALDHTAPVDAANAFRLFKKNRKKHTAIKVISIILFVLSVFILVPHIAGLGFMVGLISLGA